MAIEDEVLKRLLDRDAFEDKGAAENIARRGKDFGYHTLTAPQKAVIDPLMTLPCDGVEDPGGYHNECTKQMTDSELVQAIDDEGYYEALLCEDCRSNYYEWHE